LVLRLKPRFGMCARDLVFKEPPPLGDSTRIPKRGRPCQGLLIFFSGACDWWAATTVYVTPLNAPGKKRIYRNTVGLSSEPRRFALRVPLRCARTAWVRPATRTLRRVRDGSRRRRARRRRA